MILSRPPAKEWKTFASIPAGGQQIENPSPRLRMLGVVFLGGGDFVATPAGREDGSPEAIAVTAGQFWPLSFTQIDPATTALPLVVLWGPLR